MPRPAPRGALELIHVSRFSHMGSQWQDLSAGTHQSLDLPRREAYSGVRRLYPEGAHSRGNKSSLTVGSGQRTSVSTKGLGPAVHLGSDSSDLLSAACIFPRSPLCSPERPPSRLHPGPHQHSPEARDTCLPLAQPRIKGHSSPTTGQEEETDTLRGHEPSFPSVPSVLSSDATFGESLSYPYFLSL